MKIGILLSGCGVYDGAEIHESVLTMLAIQEANAEYVCIGVNELQHHVINHLNGEEMHESRNMLTEAARIARGEIVDIEHIIIRDLDALVIPGGFGNAKSLTTWAFDGPDGEILPSVRKLILELAENKKPIAALCVSPIVVAKALEGSEYKINMTIGSDKAASPYNISEFSQGIQQTGAFTEMKTIHEILIDEKNKIVTAPCYMMDVSLLDIRNNIQQAINALVKLIV
jgi:enhancing lycopene biosynthesis protein 2